MSGHGMHLRCPSQACNDDRRFGRGQYAVNFPGCDRSKCRTKFHSSADSLKLADIRERFFSVRTRPKFARIEIRNSEEYES